MSGAFVRAYFAYKRWIEDPFAALAARRPELFRGGHIVDVGANVGYTATVFARAADREYRVFAFEPDAANLRALTRTIERYRAKGRIVPIHAAVGADESLVELWRNPAHPADHRIVTPEFADRLGDRSRVVPVRAVTLDRYLAQQNASTPIALIKIDVQGYELAVCRGMTRTLELNPHAAVAVEYHPPSMRELGFEPAALEAFFRDRGYFVYTVGRRGTLQPFDDRQRTTVEHRGYVDLLCSRPEL